MNRKRVTVYCASSSSVNEKYLESAEDLGKSLARNGIEIIYGGGKVGLMGRLADGVLSEGGKVIGVIPNFMQDIELGHNGISELRVVGDMHIRQAMMLKETDCIVALPGGSGTMHEVLEAISWKRLGLIITPVIIVNLNNYSLISSNQHPNP